MEESATVLLRFAAGDRLFLEVDEALGLTAALASVIPDWRDRIRLHLATTPQRGVVA